MSCKLHTLMSYICCKTCKLFVTGIVDKGKHNTYATFVFLVYSRSTWGFKNFDTNQHLCFWVEWKLRTFSNLFLSFFFSTFSFIQNLTGNQIFSVVSGKQRNIFIEIYYTCVNYQGKNFEFLFEWLPRCHIWKTSKLVIVFYFMLEKLNKIYNFSRL